MSITTILVIISIAIVLFLFSIGGYFYKKAERKNNIIQKQTEKKVLEINKNQMDNFFKTKLNDFFSRYENEYKNLDFETNVSKLNSEYKKELSEIINSEMIKSILAIADSEYYNEAKFLKILENESPFVWIKKYEKEIREYYGK